MSTHRIDIVEIGEVKKHPNADSLGIVDMFGWQCCVGLKDFKQGDKAVYIEPDFSVNLSHPSFAFLKKEGSDKTHERIKVRRFRGFLSQGLLIPVPPELADLPVGTNVIEQLGIIRYEPPEPKSTGGDFVSGPSGLYSPKFDVENHQRYAHVFEPGEEIIATEKIHGCNSRYVMSKTQDGEWQQFCGSRTNWMKEDSKNVWWMAFRRNPTIGEWCKKHPETILYGECFGQVQKLKYGAGVNDVFFAIFGILEKNRWWDWDEIVASLVGFDGLKTVPLLYRGKLDMEILRNLAEGDSSWPKANHMREGVVIVPVVERTNMEIGRVCAKIVSNRYLEKS